MSRLAPCHVTRFLRVLEVPLRRFNVADLPEQDDFSCRFTSVFVADFFFFCFVFFLFLSYFTHPRRSSLPQGRLSHCIVEEYTQKTKGVENGDTTNRSLQTEQHSGAGGQRQDLHHILWVLLRFSYESNIYFHVFPHQEQTSVTSRYSRRNKLAKVILSL